MAGWLGQWSKKQQAKLDQSRESYQSPDARLKEKLTSLLPDGSTIVSCIEVTLFSRRQRLDNSGFWYLVRGLGSPTSDKKATGPWAPEAPTWLVLTETNLYRIQTVFNTKSSREYGQVTEFERSVVGDVTLIRDEYFLEFIGGKVNVGSLYVAEARRMSSLANSEL